MWKHVETCGNTSNSEINFQPQAQFWKIKLCLWHIDDQPASPTRAIHISADSIDNAISQRLLAWWWQENVKLGSPCHTETYDWKVWWKQTLTSSGFNHPRLHHEPWAQAVPAATHPSEFIANFIHQKHLKNHPESQDVYFQDHCRPHGHPAHDFNDTRLWSLYLVIRNELRYKNPIYITRYSSTLPAL
jgi:hypothetical protein